MTRSSAAIGIIGAGTMGAGIAQVAATNGHHTLVFEQNAQAGARLAGQTSGSLKKLAAKGMISSEEAAAAAGRLHLAGSLQELAGCALIIEAIFEDLDAKRSLMQELEELVEAGTILATNTSSLSVTSVAGVCRQQERVLGLHFFNPAPLMPLVEVIPTAMTSKEVLSSAVDIVRRWGKTPVIAKDTPGFIVNRIARPFYGEALRIHEEQIAQPATIDWAMRELAGFRMGPFELMDLIGIDVNYAVTESVFQSLYFDPRYRPSVMQKRMVEAGIIGRKSGRGFYDYTEGASRPLPETDSEAGGAIVERILAMIINEAVEALHLGIATEEDIDLAMTKGANYPFGPLQWLKQLGPVRVLERLDILQNIYGDDRYRPSRLLREMAEAHKSGIIV